MTGPCLTEGCEGLGRSRPPSGQLWCDECAPKVLLGDYDDPHKPAVILLVMLAALLLVLAWLKPELFIGG